MPFGYAKYIKQKVYVGNNTVDKDTLYHADMDTNATAEIHVTISMRQKNAIDANNLETQSISANSVVKVTLKVSIMKTILMRKQTANMFINYHRNPTVIKWMKINTLAEVISCDGTLTLLGVWMQGVMGQKVGEAAAQQGALKSRASC